MDSLLSKASGFLLARRAKQETSSLGDDVTAMSASVEEGAKRLFNRLKGKMQKALPELLESYGLPKGLFPQDATHYEFDETSGKLTVFVASICEVGFKDASVLRYATKITANLEKGKLSEIEGMKTKVLIWVKVTSISADPGSKKVYFTAGVKKARPLDAYDVLRNGIEVDTF